MAKSKNFLRLLSLGILVILFWVSVWDIIETLVDKVLEKVSDKNDDNGRILLLSIIGSVAVYMLYKMNALNLLD